MDTKVFWDKVAFVDFAEEQAVSHAWCLRAPFLRVQLDCLD